MRVANGLCAPPNERRASAFAQALELCGESARGRPCHPANKDRGKASSRMVVVLHLRSCYVSKARDFGGSGTFRAGRKSKSRLNSKGLAAWRRIVATVFPLRI
jgi:hypothetical protein